MSHVNRCKTSRPFCMTTNGQL